jgi:hypothetical protein
LAQGQTWEPSFVATSVALGGTVDEALAALDRTTPALDALVARLRAPQRAQRAMALAEAVRDLMFAIEAMRLR